MLLILLILIPLMFFSCQKETFVESKNTDIVNYCSAYISSNPIGAKIYIDGKYSGRNTPDTVKWISKGNHNIRLRFNSVMDTLFTLQTDYAVTPNVFIDYFATFNHYGNIYCTSAPKGSEIFLNGITTSKFTPDTLKYLWPGNYTVRYSQFRYRSDSLQITVKGGGTATSFLRLQDTTEWLDYRVNNSGIASNKIVCFAADKNNVVWAGTYESGLSRCESGIFRTYNTSNSGIPSNFITCIDIDENDDIWVGTMNGLAKFDGFNWTVYNKQTGFASDYITSVYCRNSNNVYVGTKIGLGFIENGIPYSVIMQDTPLLSNYINSIKGKPDGTLWVASVGGISCRVNDHWRTFTKNAGGLIGYDAGDLDIDSFGNIWCSFPSNYALGINVAGGLMKYDGTLWTEFKLPSGYKGKIQRVVCDMIGDVWLATQAGFYLIMPDNTIIPFASSGYAMVTFNGTDILVDARNKVWFALWDGGMVKCKLKIL